VIAASGGTLGDAGRLALSGGVALYLAGLFAVRWRLLGSRSLVKGGAAVVLLLVGIFATGLTGWAAALVVACVLAAVGAGEVLLG
jgi:hypothetical protein